MLVVIVVAAATAFSFFVASYQKQVQAQETLQHDKNLENLRILSLEPTVGAGVVTALTVELASLDPNSIVVQGMDLDGDPIVNYSVVNSAGNVLGEGCLNGNPVVPTNSTCTLSMPAESQVFLSFDLEYHTPGYAFPTDEPTLTESSLIEINSYTSLGNEFSQSFVPPVAIAGVTFVDSYPVLDGSGSYQPSESNESVTINQWQWSVTAASHPANDTADYAGEEVELPDPFTAETSYTIYLNVTSSDSLEGSVSIVYEFA